MPFTLEETPESRAQDRDGPSLQLVYIADGEFSDLVVGQAAKTSTPATFFTAFGVLYRGNIRLEPLGYMMYRVYVDYGKKKKDTGTFAFSFDTSGATVRIKGAKQHMADYGSDGINNTNKHKGSIGVNKDGDVEGTDIVTPALKLTFSFRHPAGDVKLRHAKQLARFTGFTNVDPWPNVDPLDRFDAGELLFLGASGSDGTDAEAEVSYHMIASENATGLTIGEITGIAKGGHHVLWIEFKDEDENGKASTQPDRVYIERIADPVDFAMALGWS